MRDRLSMRLRPISVEGASTWISVSGPVATKTMCREIRALITILATVSDAPVHVALSAGDEAAWREGWFEGLHGIPEGRLELRLRRPRRGRAVSARRLVERAQLSFLRE
jgi:hypothetical protein